MKRTRGVKISSQITTKVEESSKLKRIQKYKGNDEFMLSTGSTLLDLAISGGRVRGGGIPGGILVEVFGPSGSGKTVLLCEIAGALQRHGGEVMFKDPEARLNKQFAKIFDFDVSHIDVANPDTIPEVFKPVREWKPKDMKKVNGVFVDSLAALSTNLELGEKGDKIGMRRAKEFSEELRKTCRIITKNNLLVVMSNQVRDKIGAGEYEVKVTSPGGQGIGFYSSLRLRMVGAQKIVKKITVNKKEVKRVIGITTYIEVFKSSIWEPFRQAPVTILFNYGIDDIRQNLQFVKDYTKETIYSVRESLLDKSMDKSIVMIEEANMEKKLRRQVIEIWEDIETKFTVERKSKRR